MELTLVIVWLSLAVAAGFYADRLNRSFGWAFLAILLSPLVAFALLFALGENPEDDEDEDRGSAGADRMPCPFCAEEIKTAAIICPHCRSDLESPQALRAIQRRLQNESESESV